MGLKAFCCRIQPSYLSDPASKPKTRRVRVRVRRLKRYSARARRVAGDFVGQARVCDFSSPSSLSLSFSPLLPGQDINHRDLTSIIGRNEIEALPGGRCAPRCCGSLLSNAFPRRGAFSCFSNPFPADGRRTRIRGIPPRGHEAEENLTGGDRSSVRRALLLAWIFGVCAAGSAPVLLVMRAKLPLPIDVHGVCIIPSPRARARARARSDFESDSAVSLFGALGTQLEIDRTCRLLTRKVDNREKALSRRVTVTYDDAAPVQREIRY